MANASRPIEWLSSAAIVLEPEYWFAWSEFHADTAIYSRALAPTLSRCAQRRTLLGENERQKFCGLGVARVLGNLVCDAGRFVKHVPDHVGSLPLSRDLGDNRAFQHVGEHEPGMAMRVSDPPGCVVDVADRYLPTIHREVREIVFEHGPAIGLRSGLRSLSLSVTA